MVYSQIKKQIVPLGVSIDEEQIRRVQLTRQAERGRHVSQDWGWNLRLSKCEDL